MAAERGTPTDWPREPEDDETSEASKEGKEGEEVAEGAETEKPSTQAKSTASHNAR